ncbi:uncharacterized protein LOC124326972 isoform X3 [Daphnia pulicaria]|uniref:uncharacterized protein LOC124326972 isoform X3 n=1 Tax=Daphnia pulicaria TaxID=35523 RepID=UPI001EEA7DB9|nr:uncharacterized protein LOC124326972 isoform X3 [Daphnia pulicaria]
MPRRLEIRTTILGKKSDERSRRKDSNANDLYADEALQLLEEIEQLKSNIQKTDERILGTYTKSPCKAKKKKPEVPARKVVYDVFYPAMDAAGSRVEEEKHGRRRPVRDTVVSHCLNAGGASARAAAAAMAYSDDDDDVTPSAFATYSVPGRPWISCTTNFTPAPMASQFTEPSHGPSFWPVAATTTRRTQQQQQQQQQRSNLDDEKVQPTIRHDEPHQRATAVDNQSATGGGSSGDTNGEQPTTGRVSSFKRIYATSRASSTERNAHLVSGGNAGGRQDLDGHVGDGGGGGGEDDDDDREDKPVESCLAVSSADGENSGHASMPLNSTDLSNNLGPQWVDGAEVDESFQPVPPEIDSDVGRPAAVGLLEEDSPPEQVPIHLERLDDNIVDLPAVPEEQELTTDPGNNGKAERVRHYDRDEIRQYMQKQKKERKEKATKGSAGYVCHHTRISPIKRSDLGLPDKPLVQIKRKQQQPKLGPDPTNDKPKPEKIISIPKIVQREKTKKVDKEPEKKKPREQEASREKCVQTEPMLGVRQTTDEATQMTARSEVNDSSTDWLHTVPTSATTGRTAAQLPPPEMMVASSQSTMERIRSTGSVSAESSSRSRFLPRAHPASAAADDTKPKPVTNLIQKIEDLEHYIGNLLEASSFQSLKTPAVHEAHPSTVERPRDVAPSSSYRPSPGPEELPKIRRQVPTKMTSFRPPPPSHLPLHPPAPMSPPASASLSSRTVPDGPTRVAHPPPTPPTRISSVQQQQQPQPYQLLDTTASTEYHPLPDHLAAFLQLDNRRSRNGSPTVCQRPEVASQSKADPKPSDGRSRYVTEEAAELSSLFQRLSRLPEATAAAGQTQARPKPAQQHRPTGAAGREAEEPQTYFRDFNEILQMDPNPLTERSNSWKRVASRPAAAARRDASGADGFPLPAMAPYNILSALSDELKATMKRIPRGNDNSSDSDFQSRLSVSDISVPDAVAKVATYTTANAQLAQPGVSSSSSPHSSSKNEIQLPKNGSGSRTGVHEAGSRMSNQLESHPGPPPVANPPSNDETDASQIPQELDTTYLTLTPQYTSFEATFSLARPLDSTSITESGLAAHPAESDSNNRSMFSTKLSPIPRAISPLTLNSDSDSSAINTERKQSTSSSDRSERERSIGTENVVNETTSRLVTTPSSRTVQPLQPGSLAEEHAKKSDELLARLRAEIQRDESLYRSIQHVDRLEDSAIKDSSKRFRIQIDSKTRTFFEAQTDALRSIAQDVRGGLAANASVFLQGSQAAMEVDRVQSQTRKTLDSGRQTYSSDFDEPSVRSSPEIPTEMPTESQAGAAASTAQSASQQSPKRSTDFGSDSERSGLDSSALSNVSVLPPKAVDVLLQEEAKQQRLLLKLREKAQVEKTLAELELLQMQKRILRAQGERDKAASIKKKQRGLLLKLQEERARIEALRRQHKKEEQRSKASSDYQHYDSSSWETDVSAVSNSTVGAGDTSASIVGEASNIDQLADSSSTSTLQQVISEAAHIQPPSSNDEAVDDDAEVSQQLSRSTRSELEGHDSGSALSNLRLRAPLSPRTTADSIRFRTKFRRRHSSGSDDSINLSQNETASDVSDVESRLLALTDQLQRRQTEAQRLKTEHRRLSKEKFKAQESALIKQIEVYDRCITDLRSQLDADAETGATANAVLAVRPVIRQPRALIRADEAKSPTSARSESEPKISESESAKSLEVEGQTPPTEHKAVEQSSGSSSISTQIQTEADESIGQLSDHESVRGELLVEEGEATMLPVVESAESEKSLSELSTDPSAAQDNQAEISDSGRTDLFNQTMIIKSDVQVREELAEEISRSILDILVEETITLAMRCLLKKKKETEEVDPVSSKTSADVLQRVSALLSTSATEVPKENRSQLYLTTTFDLLSPDDGHSPISHPAGNTFAPPCDLTSAEGRDALESKLNDLRFDNEWIDDDLEVAPVLPDSAPDENRDKVIQEAEALEREQKRIEQEIQRLSSGSVLYLREIPNKPPPPYTPPGQALTWQKIRSPVVAENKQIVPKSKEDVARYCKRFTEFLLDNHSQPDIPIPDELLTVDLQSQSDQPAEWQDNCRAFLSLLADLSRLHLAELRKRSTFLAGQKFVGGRPIRSRMELVKAVESAVLVQMNYQPRLLRESQLARWSQKKRDRVDEILVRELQIEEKFWTDFSSEEVQVKHQTAEAILDLLLDETAFICKRIMQTAK